MIFQFNRPDRGLLCHLQPARPKKNTTRIRPDGVFPALLPGGQAFFLPAAAGALPK
jgi:hypothetical protein